MAKNNKKVNKENKSEEIKEQLSSELAESVEETAEEGDPEAVGEAAENAAEEAADAQGGEKTTDEKSLDGGRQRENPPKEDNSEKGKAKSLSGKKKRLKHGALSVTFTVIFVAAIVLLNIIFNMVLDRFDVSADLSDKSVYSIDATTEEYLSKLEDDISIIVTAKENDFKNTAVNGASQTIQSGQQVSQIIKAFVASNSRISSEYRSLDDNPAFYSKYGATLQSNSIIVESQKTGRNKIISSSDYLSPKYYLDGSEISSTDYYYYSQLGLASSGRLTYEVFAAAESSLLTAIMTVTNDNPVRVAYVSEDYGCSEPAALDSLLEANAYTIEEIKLTTADKIDPDIDFLVIFAPIYDFSNDDINKIDVWLDNGGMYGKNLLYAAAATIDVLPKLNEYLKEWGLSLESGYVYQTNTDYGAVQYPTYQKLMIEEGDYSEGIDTTTKSTQGDGLKPITRLFEDKSNYSTASIVSSYSGAVIAPFNMEGFDPSKAEQTGSFTVVAESNKSRFEGWDPYYSRVYVMSSHYLLDQTFLQATSVNNADLLLNIFNIASGKEKVEISVTPKSFSLTTFEISGTQAKTITVIFAVAVPLAVIAAGVIVIVRRKRR